MPLEYRVNWAGGIGGQGVTVFHGRPRLDGQASEAAQELAERARAFFAALAAGIIPATVTLSFESEAVNLDTTTGTLLGVIPVDPPDNVVGGAGTVYARPSGLRVDWLTDAVVAGRRLRGRTFLVPASSGAFLADGTPGPAVLTLVKNAADDFYDSTLGDEVSPSIWSRTHGIQADITGASVPDEAAILSSRRD